MNALEQVKDTLYRQQTQYLTDHPISPNDLTVRITVSPRTRSYLIQSATLYCPMHGAGEGVQETILGQPLEVAKDVQDGVYYLDLIVYNRVQKQLKFTLQGDGGHE